MREQIFLLITPTDLLKCRVVSPQWNTEINGNPKLMKRAWSEVPAKTCIKMARKGNVDFFAAMVKWAPHPNPVNEDGVTPLEEAAKKGRPKICQLIIENTKVEDKEMVCCLNLAARNGHLEVCQLIMDHIENKNPADEEGDTPLHVAAKYGHLEVCSFIIAHSDDKNPANAAGNSPLHLAAMYGHLEVYRFIIAHSDDKNPTNAEGNSPLHLAAKYGRLEVCRFIIANSEDKSLANALEIYHNPAAFFRLQNAAGDTPLDLAANNGHVKVCRFIMRQTRIRIRQATTEFIQLRPTSINVDKLLKAENNKRIMKHKSMKHKGQYSKKGKK